MNKVEYNDETASQLLQALCLEVATKRDPIRNDDLIGRVATFGWMSPADDVSANRARGGGAPSTPSKMSGDGIAETARAVVTTEKNKDPKNSSLLASAISTTDPIASEQVQEATTGAGSSPERASLKDDAAFEEEFADKTNVEKSLETETGDVDNSSEMSEAVATSTYEAALVEDDGHDKAISGTEASETTITATMTSKEVGEDISASVHDGAGKDDHNNAFADVRQAGNKEDEDEEAVVSEDSEEPDEESSNSEKSSDVVVMSEVEPDEESAPNTSTSVEDSNGAGNSVGTDGNVTGNSTDVVTQRNEPSTTTTTTTTTTTNNNHSSNMTTTTTTTTTMVRTNPAGHRIYQIGNLEGIKIGKVFYEATNQKLTKMQRESLSPFVYQGIEYTFGLAPTLKANNNPKKRKPAPVLRGAVRASMDGLKNALDGLSDGQYDAAIEELKQAKRAKRARTDA